MSKLNYDDFLNIGVCANEISRVLSMIESIEYNKHLILHDEFVLKSEISNINDLMYKLNDLTSMANSMSNKKSKVHVGMVFGLSYDLCYENSHFTSLPHPDIIHYYKEKLERKHLQIYREGFGFKFSTESEEKYKNIINGTGYKNFLWESESIDYDSDDSYEERKECVLFYLYTKVDDVNCIPFYHEMKAYYDYCIKLMNKKYNITRS